MMLCSLLSISLLIYFLFSGESIDFFISIRIMNFFSIFNNGKMSYRIKMQGICLRIGRLSMIPQNVSGRLDNKGLITKDENQNAMYS